MFLGSIFANPSENIFEFKSPIFFIILYTPKFLLKVILIEISLLTLFNSFSIVYYANKGFFKASTNTSENSSKPSPSKE